MSSDEEREEQLAEELETKLNEISQERRQTIFLLHKDDVCDKAGEFGLEDKSALNVSVEANQENTPTTTTPIQLDTTT